MVINVTYDLKKPGQDYMALIEELKKLGAWWHYLASTWLIETTLTPNQVWDRIGKYLDKNDFILIIEMKKGTATGSQGLLPKDAWDWINARL